MAKLPDHFMEIVEIKKIKAWQIGQCDKCKEGIYFMFRQGKVYFDETCDCSPRDKSRVASWAEVAETFNSAKNPKVKQKYTDFWHLD